MIMNLESPSSTKSPTPYLTTPGLRTPGITTSATAFTFNLENVPTAPSLSANVNVTSFPLLSPALDEVLANIEASDLQASANKSKNLTKSSSTESLPTVKSNNGHDPNNNESSKNFNSEFTGTKRSSVHFDTNSALFPKIKQSRQRGIDNSEGYHSMFGSISSSTTTSRLNSSMCRSIRSNVFEAETPGSVMTDMNNCMLSRLEDPFSTSTEKSKQLTRSQTINHELGQNPNQNNKIINKFRFESHGEISSDSSSKNINSKFPFVPPPKKSDKKEKLTVAQRRNIKLPSFDIKSKSLNGLAGRDRPTDNNNNTNVRLQLPNKTKISSPEGGSTSSESRSGTYIVNHSLTSSTISSGNDENFNYLQSGSNNNSVNSNLGNSLNSEIGGNSINNQNNCTTSSPLQIKGKGLNHVKSLVWAGTFLFILVMTHRFVDILCKHNFSDFFFDQKINQCILFPIMHRTWQNLIGEYESDIGRKNYI